MVCSREASQAPDWPLKGYRSSVVRKPSPLEQVRQVTVCVSASVLACARACACSVRVPVRVFVCVCVRQSEPRHAGRTKRG